MKRKLLLFNIIILVFFGTICVHAAYNESIITQVIVPEGYDYVVMDTLDGVEARYRVNSSDTYGEYSCAGFASRYFREIYDINLYNLIDGGPPSPTDKLVRVTEPQKGDLIFYPSPPNVNNHSAIVKRVESDKIIVIEQNYKWRDANGNTYTYIDRTIPYPSNDYQIWRAVNATIGETDSEQDDKDIIDAEPLFITFMIDGCELMIDDGVMEIDAPPFIENGKTMLPLKYLALVFGLEHEGMLWNPDGYVTVESEGISMLAKIGDNILYVNGEAVEMDAPVMLRHERTYLPVKYLADALGVEYFWNAADRSVIFILSRD